MTDLSATLRRSFLGQSRSCGALGSPFSAGVLAILADPLAALTAALTTPWAEAALERVVADAVPLRLLGALHHLVLTGAEPELAALYPPRRLEPNAPALGALLPVVIARRRAEIEAFLSSPPQTNEVRRTLALVGGFLTIARETGLPLRCLEIGASAGLNLSWDRFRYSFSEGACWGDARSPVRMDGDWRGSPPPVAAALSVVERAACDVAPVDVSDPEQALRLQAYVWPDQIDRMERLRAAIDLARAAGIVVERSDAAAWVAERLRPQPGVVTVLYHSVMWQYMPAQTQAAITATLQSAGAAATAESPVAHLRLEPAHLSTSDMEVRLTLWPSGEERLLARAHPHGAWVEWLGPRKQAPEPSSRASDPSLGA